MTTLKSKILAKAELCDEYINATEEYPYGRGKKEENARLLPLITALAERIEDAKSEMDNQLIFDRMRTHGLRAEVRALGIEIIEHNPKPEPGDWMQISTQRLMDLVSVAEDAAYIVKKLERALASLDAFERELEK